jgi:hypothetical protein
MRDDFEAIGFERAVPALPAQGSKRFSANGKVHRVLCAAYRPATAAHLAPESRRNPPPLPIAAKFAALTTHPRR